MIKNRYKSFSFKTFKIVKLNNIFFINIPTTTISTVQVYDIKYYQITKTALKKLLSGTFSTSNFQIFHKQ